MITLAWKDSFTNKLAFLLFLLLTSIELERYKRLAYNLACKTL